jgi:hypothetical protein
MNKDECCPKFNPKKWDHKTNKWKNKPFIKETIPTFFHIPFPPMIGKKIMKMWNLAEKAKAEPKDKQEWIVLFHDPSPFKSELFMSSTKKVPGANNVNISGTFISKVFDGPYNAVPKFIKQMDSYLEKKGKKAKDYYIHYAYCPKCSKKYNHNYAVLFAKI